MSGSGIIPLVVRNLLGINRKDGSDKVANNQFYKIQNRWFYLKGLLYKRFGTTDDLTSAQTPGANRISAIHRHFNPNKEKYALYHCEPTVVALLDNTADLTLTEIATGDLFNGGAVEDIRVCYSAIGYGIEQSYNSKNRASFVPLTNAWLNTGHQKITLSANTKGLRITAPTFQTGWRAINVFAARGTSSEMTYVGTITTSGGTLDFKHYIGAYTAASDAFGTIGAVGTTGGSLKPGTYHVALAWITNPKGKEADAPVNYVQTSLSTAKSVTVGSAQNAIAVTHSLALSTNFAAACYVFVGQTPENQGPMTCVGMLKSTETFTITSIPDNYNAQSHPKLELPASAPFAVFDQSVRGIPLQDQTRYGFIIKKDSSNALSEVFVSRTLRMLALTAAITDAIYGTSATDTSYFGFPRTANDSYTYSAYNWGRTVYDPEFSYFNGMSYFVNGIDIPWMTDGKVLGQICRKNGTTLPPYPRFITVFESCLLVAGAEAKNQIFASNANDSFNWAVGGTGTAKRFVPIGDLFGDECTGLGIFSYTEQGNNDPRSYFVAFKKNGAWMKDSFPDPTSGVGAPTEMLDGSEGCTAYRTITQTKLGLVYLASDGVVRLIRGTGRPIDIGSSVKSLLEHLGQNDTLMQKCSAVFHDGHYKLSYPSSPSSTYNDAQLWADLRTESGDPITWVGPHTGINVGHQIVFNGESDDKRRVAVKATGVGAIRCDDPSVMTDLGTAITSIVESKQYRAGAEIHKKRLFGLHADVFYDTQYNHTFLMELMTDDQYAQKSIEVSNGGGVWDSSSWDAAKFSDADYRDIPWILSPESPLIGRLFKFRITDSNQAQSVIAAVVLPYKPERRMII